MKAIVNVPVCPLYQKPTRECSVVDEVLYGMVVEILDEVIPGWLHVRTHYRYEGIACADDLLLDEKNAENWDNQGNQVVLHKNFCDVLQEPKVQGWIMQTLPLGSRLIALGAPEKGWQQVQLADGRRGYTMAGILGAYRTAPVSTEEGALRRALTEAVLSYR